MSKPKNLLFVTWDSESTNYLESLFFPIFRGLQDSGAFRIHVMQFSWASQREIQRLTELAESLDIVYVQYPIHRKPIAVFGALWSVYQGASYIKQYIADHQIEILMPRSTMPAMMVNRVWSWLSKIDVSLVFDADGLPLEERVDFAGLKRSSYQYRNLKQQESRLLTNADLVLSRSQAAVDIHVKNLGQSYRDKFRVVANGRDAAFFRPDPMSRKTVREALGLGERDMLWVYTGSLGLPYEVDRMLRLFGSYHEKFPNARFLILTRQGDYLKDRIPEALAKAVVVRSGTYDKIPGYLAAADLGLSLRKFAPSLAGLAPIKLGEYLLMGLPVIVSPGVGDTEALLQDLDFVWMLTEQSERRLLDWIQTLDGVDRRRIRDFGLRHFSLDKSIDDYMLALDGIVGKE